MEANFQIWTEVYPQLALESNPVSKATTYEYTQGCYKSLASRIDYNTLAYNRVMIIDIVDGTHKDDY
jgi:hypothetical protein